MAIYENLILCLCAFLQAGLKATGKAGSPSSGGTGGGGSGGGGAKAASSKAAPAASRARGQESNGGGAGGKLSGMIKRKQVKTEPLPDMGGFDLGQLQLRPQVAVYGQQDEQLPSYDDATAFVGEAPQHTAMGTAMLPLDELEQDWAAAPPPSYDEVVGESDVGGMSK